MAVGHIVGTFPDTRVCILFRGAPPGIVVGTLGVSRYLGVVASVRRLIERAGKKAYTLVVGKLNPAKLANFAEVRKGNGQGNR